MSKHQKKRNSALMYEFLIRAMSSYLIEGDKTRSNISLKILKKYYDKNTELYKEFKLINALVKSHVNSEAIASSILGEAKQASRRLNAERLEKEKTQLIHSINHQLNDPLFYDRSVNEYRTIATAYMLINEWVSISPNIEKLALYENNIALNLVKVKTENESNELLEGTPGANRLLLKIMTEKLNKKYEGVLTKEQKDICRSYLWSVTKDDVAIVVNKLKSISEGLVSSIDKYTQLNESNVYICQKLNETKQRIQSESFDNIDDSTIVRFMQYIKLKEELVESKEETNE